MAKNAKMEENNGEWTVVQEDGRTVRRRVYTIPAATESCSDHSGNKTKKPISKQQRMLRQIKAQKELEREQQEVLEACADVALRDQILKYLKTIWILITVGGLLLYIYAPEIVYKWLFTSKPALVDRALMTVYPRDVRVRKDLPLVFNNYAVVTSDNELSRRAVKHVAQLRRVVRDAGPFKQRIRFHPWEHADFTTQIKKARIAMDDYCGPGFQERYRKADSLKKQDDLLIWCFLARGNHDGYVKFEVKKIRSRITRGRKGVAIRYLDQKRIHGDSLLLLPIQDLKDLKEAQAINARLEPSTMVGYTALEWLRVNAGLPEEAYKKVFEEYLFEQIEREGERWEIWNLACSKDDIQRLQTTQRLMGSTCEDDEKHQNSEEECCSFFDPGLQPILAVSNEEE